MKIKPTLTALTLGLFSISSAQAADIIRFGIGLAGSLVLGQAMKIKCGSKEDSTDATEVPAVYHNLPVLSIQQANTTRSGQPLKVAGEFVLQGDSIDAFSDEHQVKNQGNILNIKLSTDIACHHNGGAPYDGEKLYLYGEKNSDGWLEVKYWEPQYPLIRQSYNYATEYDYPSFQILEQTAQYDETIYAQFLLGKAYYEGKLTVKNDKKALEWAKKSYRAELPLHKIYFSSALLGLLYAEKKEFKQAKPFLENVWSHFSYGREDNKKEMEILGTAEFYGKAIYTLGMMYYQGNGVQKDLDRARNLFKMVMETEEYGLKYAPAEESFRKLYAEKYKTPYSADQHHINYFFNIALEQYNSGEHAKALDTFEKLAKTGDTDSQVMAGLIYYESEQIPQNIPKAKEWYLKAIEYKNPLAAYNLAVIYKNEENNHKKARYYYQKSCEWGEKQGCEVLK